MSDKEIKPVIKTDPLYQMLRQEDVDNFNASRDSLDTAELTGGDYRGRDLRRMNARGLDFSNAYFRNCDLSGIDFRETNLKGASLMDAKVSGSIFQKHSAPMRSASRSSMALVFATTRTDWL